MAEFARFGALSRTIAIPNYRNYMSGNFCSQLGMWIQRIAVGWLTWELTKSPTWLGIMSFADFCPNILLAPLAGALADRLDRLRSIRLYVFLSSVITSTMAGMTLEGMMTVHLLLVLVLINGTVMSFNYPARLSIIYALVGREMLTSAVSVNSLMFNIARIGGPALAGFLIVRWGSGAALAFTATANIVFIVSLFRVKLLAEAGASARRPARDIPSEIMEGYRYAAKHPGIGPLLMVLIMTSMFARPVIDLFPGFSGKVFGRGAEGLAWLTAMIGVGAFGGGLVLARIEGVGGLTRMMMNGTIVFSLALLGFVATGYFPLALAFAVVMGYAMVTIGVAGQTLLQSAVEASMRGRVLSLYTLIARGCPSIGSLMMGRIAEYTGLRWPVAGGAVICFLVWLWLRQRQAVMAKTLEVEAEPQA